MLQKPCSLLFNKLRNHVAQYRSYCIKPLVCCANVVQPMIIEKNLLDDEDGDCFAKLRSSLHYAKAQRYDLSREEEVDYI